MQKYHWVKHREMLICCLDVSPDMQLLWLWACVPRIYFTLLPVQASTGGRRSGLACRPSSKLGWTQVTWYGSCLPYSLWITQASDIIYIAMLHPANTAGAIRWYVVVGINDTETTVVQPSGLLYHMQSNVAATGGKANCQKCTWKGLTLGTRTTREVTWIILL
jgi:hypothetical protein